MCNGSAALDCASSCSGLAVWRWRIGQWWRVCDCFRMAGGVWLLHRMLGGTMMLLEICVCRFVNVRKGSSSLLILGLLILETQFWLRGLVPRTVVERW